MPPRIQITEQKIIDAAVALIREEGIEALNARSLAKRLGCSVQPLFRVFANMGELKEHVTRVIGKQYEDYLMQSVSAEDRMLGLLFAYVRYAQEEKNFFKLLHMSDRLGLEKTEDFTQTGVNIKIIETISNMTGLSLKDSQTLYVGAFFSAHGIASMLATNHCSFTDETIKEIITTIFEGMLIKLKSQPEYTD